MYDFWMIWAALGPELRFRSTFLVDLRQHLRLESSAEILPNAFGIFGPVQLKLRFRLRIFQNRLGFVIDDFSGQTWTSPMYLCVVAAL